MPTPDHHNLSSPTSDRGSRPIHEVPHLERGGRHEESPQGRQADPILHVRRDDLRPDVREYTDNLGAQVAIALRELGVKDIAGYEQLVRERRIPESKVRAFKELMAQFAEAVKRNEAPETPEDEAEREYQERVVDFVRRAVDAGSDVIVAIEAVAGIGTEEAWKLREEAYVALQKDNFTHGTSFIVRSLAGLDDERSWQFRERLRRPHGSSLAESLIGLDSERSWQERELILRGRQAYDQKQHIDPETYILPKTLAGMDSERAWAFRDRLAAIPGMEPRWTLPGLAGVDSERSWEERSHTWQNISSTFSMKDFGQSSMALDSPRAWEDREGMLKRSPHDLDAVVLSLVGLDSERAWELRHRLFESPNFLPMWLLESVAGVRSERAWDIRESQFDICVNYPHNLINAFGTNLYAGLRSAQRRERRQRIIGV